MSAPNKWEWHYEGPLDIFDKTPGEFAPGDVRGESELGALADAHGVPEAVTRAIGALTVPEGASRVRIATWGDTQNDDDNASLSDMFVGVTFFRK